MLSKKLMKINRIFIADCKDVITGFQGQEGGYYPPHSEIVGR